MGRTLTGAWIETPYYIPFYYIPIVAPSRVRGLKPALTRQGGHYIKSHPHGCVD